MIKLKQEFSYEKWYVHNIFTINLKWQVVTDCYCWGKKSKTQKWDGQLKAVEFYYYITSFITRVIRFLFLI